MTLQISRVVVRLDTATESRPGIATAARLAARWRVPLHGVFIEDEELLALAGLPFALQVTLAAGRGALTRDEVEGHFRAFAERARRDLAAAAERHGIEWSFAVVRGSLAEAEHDFVVAGAVTRPLGAQAQLPSRWQPAPGLHPLLLVRREWQAAGSVMAMLRGHGPEAARLLDLAADLAELGSGILTVLGAPDMTGPDDFPTWVAEQLKAHPLTVRTELEAIEPAAVRQRLAELDCRLLVLEAGTPDEQLRQLVEHAACDVLLVR